MAAAARRAFRSYTWGARGRCRGSPCFLAVGLPVVRWLVVGAARGAFVARCTVRVGCFRVCSLLRGG